MIRNNGLLIKNRSGASLLEVMIAMVILTIGFLGVMALAVALTNNNATAGKINTATTIAQAEVSQLNCLGVSGIQNAPINFAPLPPTCTFVVPGTCTYTVKPIVSPSADARNPITSCINPALTVGGVAPDSPSPTGLGVTLPYTVTIKFSYNNPVTGQPYPASTTVINAQVEVSWQDTGQHVIIMNDLIS
jgi:hypothetical protein